MFLLHSVFFQLQWDTQISSMVLTTKRKKSSRKSTSASCHKTRIIPRIWYWARAKEEEARRRREEASHGLWSWLTRLLRVDKEITLPTLNAFHFQNFKISISRDLIVLLQLLKLLMLSFQHHFHIKLWCLPTSLKAKIFFTSELILSRPRKEHVLKLLLSTASTSAASAPSKAAALASRSLLHWCEIHL